MEIRIHSIEPEDKKLADELNRNVHDNGPSLADLIAREEARLNTRIVPADPDMLPMPSEESED